MKKIFFVLLFIISNVLSGQQRVPDKNLYQSPADTYFHQVIAVPNATLDSFNVIYFYAFKYDILIFNKDANDRYYAMPELEATFKDAGQITRKRLLTKDTVWCKSFDETINKEKIYSNFAMFSLPYNEYKITTTLLNSKYGGNIAYYNKIEKTPSFNPFFLQPIDDASYTTFISNDYIPFEAPVFSYFFTKFIMNDNNRNYWYKINKLPFKDTKSQLYDWGSFAELTGECDIIQNRLKAFINENKIVQIDFTNYNENPKINFINFTLSMATFTPGEYVLTIANTPFDNQKSDAIVYTDTFKVKWNSMPNALYNPEYACEQMYPILTDGEYKQILDGNKAEIFANIMNYWRQNDPTPGTEYNEKMTTYFNRVDAAHTLFQTLTQKQGAKTDRGKIFILNGPPDEILTEMKDKKSYEIWKYNRTHSTYKFEIVSVGNYVLIEKS